MSDQTYNQLGEAWPVRGENPDLRPFPFPAPHEQRIAELEAENGRLREALRKIRDYDYDLMPSGQTDRDHFLQLLWRICRELEERVIADKRTDRRETPSRLTVPKKNIKVTLADVRKMADAHVAAIAHAINESGKLKHDPASIAHYALEEERP